MSSRRFLHLTPMLCVRDLAASVAFYERLGFGVAFEARHIALMTLDAMRLYLFLESPPTEDKPGVTVVPQERSQTGNVIVVLGVEDCSAAYEELRGRGIAFLTPPKSPPWGGWRCFLQDPDGYVVELEQSPTED